MCIRDRGWAIDPEGLRYALNIFYERYEKPLFIVENGFGAIDVKEADGSCHDDYRINYLKAHIKEMKKAVELDGIDLIGYTPWGCIDCVSFTTGEMKKMCIRDSQTCHHQHLRLLNVFRYQ